MCEYCGCQEVAAIAELTREHDAVVTLVSQVRAAGGAGDVAAMAVIARRIAVILGPHTQVEEEGLFPALEGDFPHQVAALRAEHREVEAVLDEAAAGVPAEPGWPDRLRTMLEMLREHILKEQDGVFPAALTGLRTTDWEAVDAVRARVGTAVAIDSIRQPREQQGLARE
jgi:hemerythrin-like domain-containing protein